MTEAEKNNLLQLIHKKAETFNGKPVIGETRIKVETILYALANSLSMEELHQDFPALTEQDVRACLIYAALHIQ